MIDLTPLDVRKKRGDFSKALRGYDTLEVDSFIELVAERMEVLVKENLQLVERTERLAEQVATQDGREKAVQEALVTAQALREDVKQQARREAELTQREAEIVIDQMLVEAERMLDERKQALGELERHRLRFLKSFRSLLERELDTVEVEEGRAPLEDVAVEIDLGGLEGRADEHESTEDEATPADETVEVIDEAEGAEEDEPAPSESDAPEATDHMHDVEEPAVLEDEGEDPNDAEPSESVADEHGPAGEEPVPEEDREGASDNDDDSLWLDSLQDGESRDEGRWG